MEQDYRRKDAEGEVMREVIRAVEHFTPMRSPHEGYAIIHEELDELWEIVRQKNKARDGSGG